MEKNQSINEDSIINQPGKESEQKIEPESPVTKIDSTYQHLRNFGEKGYTWKKFMA